MWFMPVSKMRDDALYFAPIENDCPHLLFTKDYSSSIIKWLDEGQKSKVGRLKMRGKIEVGSSKKKSNYFAFAQKNTLEWMREVWKNFSRLFVNS